MKENFHNKNEPVVIEKNIIPYGSRTLDPPIDIIDQVKEIEKAGKNIQLSVNSKLTEILSQINILK